MPKSAKRFDTAAYVKGHPTLYLEELKKAGRPIVLRINDSEELTVADEESYQRLLALVDRLEAIEGVRKGLESFERGEGLPAREALEALRRKHDIPG